jgi:hypothetical protein
MTPIVRLLLVGGMLGLTAARCPAQDPPPVPVPPGVAEDVPGPAVQVLATPAEPPSPFRFDAQFGGGSVGRWGSLRPAERFANRWWLFPIPSANSESAVASRVLVGYQFERLPALSVGLAWEGYFADARTVLLGHDPTVRGLLGGLNTYNEERREDNTPGNWPRLQMRDAVSEGMTLHSRTTAHIAEAAAYWKVWTPREAAGVQYRLIAGGRYGGFFTDDAADGYGYGQRAGNWFAGFGPVGGGRVDFTLRGLEHPDRAATLYADVRGGVLFGTATQRFKEVDPVLSPATPYREWEQSARREVPFLSVETGVMLGGTGVRWGAGVRYTQYWGVGHVGPSAKDFQAFVGFVQVSAGF